ncbi:exonuclease 1 [Tanacetum coccineum]
MVHEVIKELRLQDIRFVVSPNEVDAQLALTQNNELIDVVISDDSDMVAYGCDKITFCNNMYTSFMTRPMDWLASCGSIF